MNALEIINSVGLVLIGIVLLTTIRRQRQIVREQNEWKHPQGWHYMRHSVEYLQEQCLSLQRRQEGLQDEKVDMDSFEILRLAIGNVIGRLTCRSSEEMVQIVDQELADASKQLARNTEELREEPSKPQGTINLRADKDDKVAVQMIQALRDLWVEWGAELLIERQAPYYQIKMRIK